ncbi:MAG: glycosyltransferase family 39 protein [Alphaproteobacteria bacterium]
MSRPARLAALAAITLLGGWLRFASTDFGLPQLYRPDEQWVVPKARGFERDWNPGFAIYPAAQMVVQHGVLRAWAAWKAPGDRPWRTWYMQDGEPLAYLLARRTSAAMGTLTIPATWAAASLYGGPLAGLAAAAIVAVMPLHVRDSKFATVDVAMVFWVAVALWATMRVARRGRVGDHGGAGLAAGLATATKYPAAVAAIAIAAAHVGARRREGRSVLRAWRDLRLWVAGYAFVAAFALATPYFFLDWRETKESFEYQRGAFLSTSNPHQDGSGWRWLAGHAIPDGFGAEVGLLSLAAIAWALHRRPPGSLAILAMVAAATSGLLRSETVYYRYALPLLPALAILAGGLVADVGGASAGTTASRAGSRWRPWLASAALAALLVPDLVRSVRSNALLARTDTRTLAREWILEHVPGDAKIAATDMANPQGKPPLAGRNEMVAFEDVAQARADGVGWVVSDSLPPLAYFSKGPNAAQQMDLDREARLVFDVDPLVPGRPEPVFDRADGFYSPLRRIGAMARPGPRVRIWRIDPLPSPPGAPGGGAVAAPRPAVADALPAPPAP